MTPRSARRLAALLALLVLAAGAPAARAANLPHLFVGVSPSRGLLDLSLTLRSTNGGAPSPTRALNLFLAGGFRLALGQKPSCSMGALNRRGAEGCPTKSRVGGGTAAFEGYNAAVGAPSRHIDVPAGVAVFNGPRRAGRPSLLFLFSVSRPTPQRIVLEGVSRSADGPFGSQLAFDVPPISMLGYVMALSALDVRVFHVAAATSCPQKFHTWRFRAGLSFYDRSGRRAGRPASATSAVRCGK